MALGNIIGSNVFNILLIIGATSVIKPIAKGSYAPQLVNFDVWIMIAITLMFAAALYMFGRMRRSVSILFCILYFSYNIYIYVQSLALS